MAQVYEEILRVTLDSAAAERGLKNLQSSSSATTKSMQSLTAKAWSVTVSVTDKATQALRSIANYATQLAGKAIQIPVSIAGGAMRGLGAIGGAIGNIAATGVATTATALTAFGFSAFGAAARVGELDSVLRALANTNGVAYETLASTANAVKGQGIEMASAQQLTAQFVQQQLDLSKATELARVAQDAAVIGQMNSTEALDALVHGITTQQTDVLRTVGINVDATKAQEDYAKSINKSAKELTAAEKSQAMMNAVLAAGTRIAGSYEAAMEQPGKVLRSFPRLFNDIAVAAGTGLLDAFGPLILSVYNLVKAFDQAVSTGGKLEGLFTLIGQAAAKIAAPLTPLVDRTTAWVKALDAASIDRFVDALKQFAPILAPLLAFLGAKGGLNIADMLGPLGFIIPKLNPVVAAISTLLFVVPPLRNALLQLGQTILSKLGPAMELIKALFLAFTYDAGAMGLALDKVREIFGDTVADAVQPFFQTIMELIPRIPELTAAAQALVQTGLGRLLEIGQQLAPVLQAAFGRAASAFAAILDVASKLAPILLDLGQQYFATLVRVIAGLLPVILKLAEAIGSFLVTAIQTLWPILQPLFPVILKLLEVVGKLAEVIGTVLSWVIGDITQLLTELAPTFERLAPVVQLVASAVMWLGDRLIDMMNAIIGTRAEGEQSDWVSQLADLINGLSGAIEWVVLKLGDFFSWLGTVARAAQDMATAVGNAFSQLGTNLQAAYDSTIKPVLDKISGAISAVADAASRIGGAVSSAASAIPSIDTTRSSAILAGGAAYDDGGYLPPGLSLVANRTGRPEPVLTQGQLASLSRGGATVNLNLGGLTVNAPGGDAAGIADALPGLAESLLKLMTPRIEQSLANMV